MWLKNTCCVTIVAVGRIQKAKVKGCKLQLSHKSFVVLKYFVPTVVVVTALFRIHAQYVHVPLFVRVNPHLLSVAFQLLSSNL